MLLSDLLAAFALYQTARGDAQNTRRTYSNMLRHFLHFLSAQKKEPPELADFTAEAAMKYLAAEERRKISPRSRYHKLSALRAFGKWLVTDGHLETNPAARVPLPRLNDPQRELITKEEAAALLLATERFPDAGRGVMARAVLLVFFTTGLRRCELLSLTLSDIDLAERRLVVKKGKGSKRRTMPIHPVTVQAIADWIKVRTKLVETDALFLRNSFAPLCDRSLRTLLREIQAIAGYRGKTNQRPHSMRYFFTDQLVRARVDIKTIQELLGHSSPKTTWLYIRTSDEHKREAVNQIEIPSVAQPEVERDRGEAETVRSDPVSEARMEPTMLRPVKGKRKRISLK